MSILMVSLNQPIYIYIYIYVCVYVYMYTDKNEKTEVMLELILKVSLNHPPFQVNKTPFEECSDEPEEGQNWIDYINSHV